MTSGERDVRAGDRLEVGCWADVPPATAPRSHRGVQFLVRHLAPINGTVSQLQNSARFKLAGAAPAKVLADLLGLTVATLERYASLSSGTWGEYPALRADQIRSQ